MPVKTPAEISASEFVRGADFPVIVCSPQGIILSLNKHTEELCEKKKKEMVGKAFLDFFSEPDGNLVPEIFQQTKQIETFRGQLIVTSRHEALNCSYTFFPFYYSGTQHPDFIIFGFNNALKQAQMEAELEAANRIADLNLKRLHNANLKIQSARKAEQDAIKAKEHFFANISHEIRTPLNGILGLNKLLLQTDLNGKQREFANAIYTSSEQLVKIINDLLDLSKFNSVSFKLDNFEFDIFNDIQGLVTAFRINAENKGLQFHFHMDENIPHVLIGDKHRLNQILTNLLNNAFKFTQKGAIRLHVSNLGVKDEKIQLRFDIADSGIGIAKEKIDKIFDAFTQVSYETSHRFGGTGLGLSIVKQLCDLMEGTISVQSVLEQGTCFTVNLGFPIASKPLIKRSEEEKKSYSQKQRIHILAADDNEVNRLYINNLFAPADNILVTTAVDGKEAVEKMLEQDFDFVLMDLQMPVMDGYTATQHIRKKLQNQTPIFALTAASALQEEKKCFEAGMNGIIQKPFSKEDIINVINRFFDTSHIKESSPAPKAAPMETTSADHARPTVVELNMERIHSIAGDNQKLIKEFLELSLKNIETEQVLFEKSLREGDYKEIKAIAHKIKSTFGLFEIRHVFDKLQEIEKLCLQKVPVAQIKDEYLRIEDQFEKTKALLKTKLHPKKTK